MKQAFFWCSSGTDVADQLKVIHEKVNDILNVLCAPIELAELQPFDCQLCDMYVVISIILIVIQPFLFILRACDSADLHLLSFWPLQ